MSSDNRGNGMGTILGVFVAGAAVGAAVAVLTTPRNGREMRARLKDATRDLGENLKQIPGAVQSAGAKAMKAGQAVFVQAKEEATKAYNKTVDARADANEHKGFTLDKELPRFAK